MLVINSLTSAAGSSIILETTPSDAGTKIHRLFISYRASIDGFSHCRALLGLDGAHLTSKYGGILLAATGVDARRQLFLPLPSLAPKTTATGIGFSRISIRS